MYGGVLLLHFLLHMNQEGVGKWGGWGRWAYAGLMSSGALPVITPWVTWDMSLDPASIGREGPLTGPVGIVSYWKDSGAGRNWTTLGSGGGRLVFLEVGHQGSYEREGMINLRSTQISFIQINYSTPGHRR